MLSISRYLHGEGAQSSSEWFGGYTNSDMKGIWEKTRDDLKAGQYTLKGKAISLEPHLSSSCKGTYKRTASIWQWIMQLIFGKTYRSQGHQTEFRVIDRDALEVAISLRNEGYNPALLNPANAYTPGGGYKYGARAMEEDICRRSGLAHAIDPAHKKVRNFYTLRGSELLYNPCVPIFRHGRGRAYAYMAAPVPIAVITSAAIDLNPRHKADRAFHNSPKAFEAETERRIYAQLATAADEGHDAIVLTAFGCGAFRNSPKTIAAIYKRVLNTHFKGVFKQVTFAVINDHNTGQAHNPKGNFKPFKEAFAG